MLTSILLLEGSTLRHGAAPNLPPAYCSAIDGSEIGPREGSCGTAAFFGRPVYVTDIDTDPLWADYRELALAHGLRACWSTPIFNDQAAVIGTFAIYRSPDDRYFATDGLCTHEQIHLADGLVMDNIIECPKHNGRFDYRTGAAKGAPVCVNLKTYPVKIEAGTVMIDIG